MKREKLTVKTRTTTVALAASEIKSVRFVSTKKQGYRVIEDGKIGIYGTANTTRKRRGKRRKKISKIKFPMRRNFPKTERKAWMRPKNF